MGDLKNLLTQAIKKREQIINPTYLFETYQMKYRSKEGKMAIWKTHKNPNIREPLLIYITKAYEHFVLVESRVVISYKTDVQIIRYGVGYASIHCGDDTLQFLEFNV